jgi:TolB-like protein/Flp pilus assembly protein TadD
MRLSPYYPDWFLLAAGSAYRLTGRMDAALAAYEKRVERNPRSSFAKLWLAGLYAELGRQADAEAVMAKVFERAPKLTTGYAARFLPYKDAAERDKILDTMRKAGLPDKLPLKLPDKPSIAVLPFTNMSGSQEQEYFADGMTDDLITDLSRISGLFVIARNSTFVYKNQSVDVKRVARDLGVKYVLEGSVRRAGDTVRINAQLIDATTGGHLWAERYDGSIADVFALQDKVIQKIVTALALNLTDQEQQVFSGNQTRNIEAREAFEAGWAHYLRFTPEENAKAVPYLLKAADLDPGFGRANAALALVFTRGCAWRWNEPLGKSTGAAYGIASQNLRIAEENQSSLSHVAGAHLYLYAGLHEEGMAAAARAVALDPNDPEAHLGMAWAMITTGRPEDALVSIKTAIRLNPHHAGHYPLALGVAHYALGRYEEAARVLVKALAENPQAIELAPLLAAAYMRLERRAEAWTALERYQPELSEWSSKGFQIRYKLPYEWAVEHKWVKDSILGAVELAALPPEVTVETLAVTLSQGDAGYKRRGAARILGYFGAVAKEAVPALIDALGDESRWVRVQAAESLGRIGPAAKAAVPALEKALRDPAMNYVAEQALARINGE